MSKRLQRGLSKIPGFPAAPVGLKEAHISKTETQKDFSFTSNFKLLLGTGSGWGDAAQCLVEVF